MDEATARLNAYLGIDITQVKRFGLDRFTVVYELEDGTQDRLEEPAGETERNELIRDLRREIAIELIAEAKKN